jgi:AmmeMemoRadiSam system protein A
MAELSGDDGRRLLAVARRAIDARLRGWPPPGERGEAALAEPRGAFVTLRRRADGELRGCVGYVEPRFPLIETVARAAAAAATADERFDPVTLEEVPRLTLHVSALGPLAPISPGSVRVGTHGLVVRHRGRAGLLLPQVALEHGWDAEAFLDHACRKAGLPFGTWREPGVELLAFVAEVFTED